MSQSMDLFIIIAAVLGVGGVVSASIYNLVSSATSNSSITVVGVSLKAGATPSDSPVAVTVSVKNNGGDPITCQTQTSCEVVIAGTSTGSPPTTCGTPCGIASGGSLEWEVLNASGPLTFVLSTTPAQLPAGSQTSFVLSGPLSTAGSPTFWSAGSPVTVNALFGSASTQVTVVSQ